MSDSPSTLTITPTPGDADLSALLAPYRPYSLSWLTQLRLGNGHTPRPAGRSAAGSSKQLLPAPKECDPSDIWAAKMSVLSGGMGA